MSARRLDGKVGAAALAAIGLALGVAAPPDARASLGHGPESIAADRARLGASLSSEQAQGYAVHTLTLKGGAVVHEFAAPGGEVFAVSWRGRGRPDLRQLLGDKFDVMQADTVVRAGRRLRVPLSEDRSDFVLRSGGHPGAFWGMAFLPELAPAGVSMRDLATP